MSSNGNASTPLSPQYQFQRDQGMKSLQRQLEASGRRYSTFGGQQASNLLNTLGQNEAERQYQANLNQIKLGQGALSTLGGANAAAGQNIGNAFSNMGAGSNSLYQNLGAQRNQSLQQGANALSGLGSYLAYKGY